MFPFQAKLVPIPEGYKPKEWEYYKNPISRCAHNAYIADNVSFVLQSKLIRLMVKYLKPFGVQQEYEMNMHGVWEAIKVSLQSFIL